MNRRKKLIILILIVCIIGIFAFVGSFFLGGPSLASGDKNILVLASDKDEQPGGGVDMAYMVKLENGTIANYTPVYPGGMTHPTKQALGGLEGPMRLHDCLWDGPEQGMEYAKEMGLNPYYMYRQKHMLGNLENIGYAKEGYECIYNIQIMEEKQSNYALGAGSISKFVYVDEDRIERVENVKNVEQYIDRVDEMIERKRKEIYQNVN